MTTRQAMTPSYIKPGPSQEHFQARGHGGSRLEAFSDGVFALAITMLLISTSVPDNFTELVVFVKDLIPFAICSVFVYWIWQEHVTFFWRYGLTEDRLVNRLSFVLLMIVPFYVYALKFLMSWLVKLFSGLLYSGIFQIPPREVISEIYQKVPMADMPKLMVIYGLGFIAVFGIFAYLYWYALKHADALTLSDRERLETQFSYRQSRNMVITGFISAGIAILGWVSGWPWASFFSGIAYNLSWVFAIQLTRWRKRALVQL